MTRAITYKLPSFSELTKKIDGNQSNESYVLKPSRVNSTWEAQEPRIYTDHFVSLQRNAKLASLSPQNSFPRVHNQESSIRIHTKSSAPSIEKGTFSPEPPGQGRFHMGGLASMLDLRSKIESQLLELEGQFNSLYKDCGNSQGHASLKSSQNGTFSATLPTKAVEASYRDALEEIKATSRLRCDKEKKAAEVEAALNQCTMDARQDTAGKSSLNSARSSGHGGPPDSSANLRPWRTHRRFHSSPGRMQHVHNTTRGLGKRKPSKSQLDKNLNRINLNPNGQILDVEINPMRVVPCAEAVADIEDPSCNSNGGLNSELSLVGEELICNHCESTSSPEWRRGPDGKRTLCNACGLFYSKLSRKFSKEKAANIMWERKKMGANKDRSLSQ